MANRKNPRNNSAIQLVLELAEQIGNVTLGEAVAELGRNTKLADGLAKRFELREYNRSSIRFAQLTKDCRIVTYLTPSAQVLLTFLGMYASQDGYVSITQEFLSQVVPHLKNKRTRRCAITELMEVGLLREHDRSRRHEPAIWQVHPGFVYTGKRQALSRRIRDYEAHFPVEYIESDGYIKNQLEPSIYQEAVTRKLPDGTTCHYVRITPMPPEPVDEPIEKKPPHEAQSHGGRAASATASTKHHINTVDNGQVDNGQEVVKNDA